MSDDPEPLRADEHAQRGRLGRLAVHTVRQARRAVILVVGATILLLGTIMLVTPGPGLLGILLGLGVLALEFAWAARLLKRVKEIASSRKRAEPGPGGLIEPRDEEHAA